VSKIPPQKPPHSDEWSDRQHPITEDMAFQRKTWRAERIGWVVLVVLLLLSAAGLFGHGLLSAATAQDGDGRLTVEYHRFARNGAMTRLTIGVSPPVAGDVVIRLDEALPRNFTIETVQPAPAESRMQTGGLEWLFRAGSDAASPLLVHVTLRSEQTGWLTARIGLAGSAAPVKLNIFIYP
jgi:hypothetical protein